MSLVLLVTLTACGKNAEGQLKGQSFELVEESGDVLGDITFEDNGEYRVKDKDLFGGEGVGKYEVVSKGDKDYLVFNSVPDDVGEYLTLTDDDLDYHYVWEYNLDNMSVIPISLEKDDGNTYNLDDFEGNEIKRKPSSVDYSFRFVEKK